MDQPIRSAKDMGDALRHAREQRGLSQTDLASQTETWVESVVSIETAQQGLISDTLFELLQALDIELVARTSGT